MAIKYNIVVYSAGAGGGSLVPFLHCRYGVTIRALPFWLPSGLIENIVQ